MNFCHGLLCIVGAWGVSYGGLALFFKDTLLVLRHFI